MSKYIGVLKMAQNETVLR